MFGELCDLKGSPTDVKVFSIDNYLIFDDLQKLMGSEGSLAQLVDAYAAGAKLKYDYHLVKTWEDVDIHKALIIEYCSNDVAITRNLHYKFCE